MINIVEYQRYKQLEQDMAELCRLFHHETITSRVVHLTGRRPTIVHPSTVPCERYDFVMTRFGVVKQLDDDGVRYDKSPLCVELDNAVRQQIQFERGLIYKEGTSV